LSHFASPILCWVFSREGLVNYFPGLALNHDLPDLSLLSRQELLAWLYLFIYLFIFSTTVGFYYFIYFFIHLFTCAYIVWVISPHWRPPPLSAPYPPDFQTEPVLPLSLILLKKRHKHN
jgi:hypothetical protein